MKKNKDFDNENINEEESYETEGFDIQGQTEGFIQKNSKIIIIASVVVIALVAVLLFMRYQAQEAEKKASTLMSRIVPYFESGDYEKALNGDPEKMFMGERVLGLKYIADEYKSTSQGKIASLYTGVIYLKGDAFTEALRYFETASTADSKLIRMGGLAGVATINEYKGNLKDAAKKYLEASQFAEDNYTKSRYMFYAALCYEKSGDNTNAEKNYRTIIDEIQINEFTPLAKSGLIRIGTIIE